MDNRNIIHIYIVHKNIRYIEDKHGEERNERQYLGFLNIQLTHGEN
jgi:hypothetical protein